MDVLKREDREKLTKVLSSSFYREWIGAMEEMLTISRKKEIRSDRKELLVFQLELAKIETKFWKLLKEARKRVKELKRKENRLEAEQKEFEYYSEAIPIYNHLVRISRTICDGIAWRNVAYNRFFLTSAARGAGTGAVDIEDASFQSEFAWAEIIADEFESVVLINDLTHFLRVGDLTQISKEGIILHEIKKCGKDIKNLFTLRKLKRGSKVSAQAKRLLELQNVALSRVATIKGVEVKEGTLKTKMRTHFNLLSEVLQRSEDEVVVTQEIESCSTLVVINLIALTREKKVSEAMEKLKSIREAIATKKFTLEQSNWDTFYTDERANFLRSATPYSVFPLSDRHCMGLISGHYFVSYTLDVEKLKCILEENNWEVHIITEQEVDQQIEMYKNLKKDIFTKKGSLFDFAPDEAGLLRIKRGPYHLNITPAFHCKLTMEFITLESFLELLEEMYQIASNNPEIRNKYFFPTFLNETKVWN